MNEQQINYLYRIKVYMLCKHFSIDEIVMKQTFLH